MGLKGRERGTRVSRMNKKQQGTCLNTTSCTYEANAALSLVHSQLGEWLLYLRAISTALGKWLLSPAISGQYSISEQSQVAVISPCISSGFCTYSPVRTRGLHKVVPALFFFVFDTLEPRSRPSTPMDSGASTAVPKPAPTFYYKVVRGRLPDSVLGRGHRWLPSLMHTASVTRSDPCGYLDHIVVRDLSPNPMHFALILRWNPNPQGSAITFLSKDTQGEVIALTYAATVTESPPRFDLRVDCMQALDFWLELERVESINGETCACSGCVLVRNYRELSWSLSQ